MALIPIFIQLGGATGSIGDPSGHSTERQPLSSDTIKENVTHIETQVRKFFHNGVAYATRRGVNVGLDSEKEVVIINNIDWIGKMTAIELLSDVGRYVRVSSMLAKDRLVWEGGEREERYRKDAITMCIDANIDTKRLYHNECEVAHTQED